jgi:FkbM family methyltransferase
MEILVKAALHKFDGSNTNLEWSANLIDLVASYERVRIDVGLAFNAPFTKYWQQKYPKHLIISIEPSLYSFSVIFSVNNPPYKTKTSLKLPPEGFAFLSQNYATLVENILFLPCALSNTTWDEIDFFETVDPGTSSLHRPAVHPLKCANKVTVTSLQSILTALGLQNKLIEVLKIDTQGHDLLVLLGSHQYLSNILYVQIEISTYGQYLDAPETFLVMDSFLRGNNFLMLHRDHRGDAIYLNNKFVNLANEVSHDLLEDI